MTGEAQNSQASASDADKTRTQKSFVPWIKLVVHPEHPKVLRVSRLTRQPLEVVFAALVRWFRYVDFNCAHAATGLTEERFNGIAMWHPKRARGATLVQAMMDPEVEWIELDADGMLVIRELEAHFCKSAKRRAMEAKRKQTKRAEGNCASDADTSPHDERTERGQPSASDADGRPQRKRTKSAPDKDKEEEPSSGRSSSPPKYDGDDGRAAVVSALVQEGFAENDPIIDHPNATPAYVGLLRRNLRVVKPKNPRGWLVEGICAGNYPLDPRVAAAEAAGRTRGTVDQAAAADRKAEAEREAAAAAERERFETWVRELPAETRERMIDDAIAGMDDFRRQLHEQKGHHRDPLRLPVRTCLWERWKDFVRRGGGTLLVEEALADRDEGT